MPRKAKDPNKPKKGFMDGYKKYDTSQGFGDARQWQEAFSARMGVAKAREVLGADDPLAVLGLVSGANWEEVEMAYRKKAREWHPDRRLDDPELAKEMMTKINAAYEILEEKYKV